MCCCEKPTINGQPGYSWDGRSSSTRQVDPPTLAPGDALTWDEPGRCGGMDCHSHHFRLVIKGAYSHAILVRHGAGDERMDLGVVAPLMLKSLPELDSNARYWLMHTLWSAQRDAMERSRQERNHYWRVAAAENRIKTRKRRGSSQVQVWIEPPTPVAAVEG